jgi:hypothetical protein
MLMVRCVSWCGSCFVGKYLRHKSSDLSGVNQLGKPVMEQSMKAWQACHATINECVCRCEQSLHAGVRGPCLHGQGLWIEYESVLIGGVGRGWGRNRLVLTPPP